MIGLYVCIGRQRSKRIEIAKERVTIGSDASNDLVLRDGGVEPFHGALLRLRDRWFLSSREANARSSNRMHALEDGARLQIGEYTLVLAAGIREIEPRPARLPLGTPPAPMPVATPEATTPAGPRMATPAELLPVTARMGAAMPPPMPAPAPAPEPAAPEPARDPVEQALIDAILRGDEDSRLVYADWLEARGDAPRAEFLRLQRTLAAMDPADPAQRGLFDARLARLGELAPRVDFAWRRLLGRPVVEGCNKVVADFRCKMDWGALEPTDRPNVRRCGACGDDVYYVTTIRAAREHAVRGRCIAVDFSQPREPNDLEDAVLALRSPRALPRLPTA